MAESAGPETLTQQAALIIRKQLLTIIFDFVPNFFFLKLVSICLLSHHGRLRVFCGLLLSRSNHWNSQLSKQSKESNNPEGWTTCLPLPLEMWKILNCTMVKFLCSHENVI